MCVRVHARMVWWGVRMHVAVCVSVHGGCLCVHARAPFLYHWKMNSHNLEQRIYFKFSLKLGKSTYKTSTVLSKA